MSEVDRAGGRDAALETSRFWFEGEAMMTLRPNMLMLHEEAVLLLEGVSQWGSEYGFLEADMMFLERGMLLFRAMGWGQLVDPSRSARTDAE